MTEKTTTLSDAQQRLLESVEEIARQHGIDPNNPEQLRALLIACDRKVCEEHLYWFARKGYPHQGERKQFLDGWHVAAICYHLQALWEGTLYTLDGEPADTLVVNIPPGHSKSSVASVIFSAWTWAKQPSAGQWFSSFGPQLCNRDSLWTRQFVESEWFQERWGHKVQLDPEQHAKTLFYNQAGGWRLAASTKSGSGFGTHPALFGWDDPLNPKRAVSSIELQEATDYWVETISTRGVVHGVKRFLIAQRLHEDDPSGYILQNEDSVCHLMLPLEFEPDRKCRTRLDYNELIVDEHGNLTKVVPRTEWEDPRTEQGELLWPQGMDEKKVSKLKKQLRRAHAIAGQLQQRPTSPEGDMFLAEWFLDTVDKAPSAPACRAWDLASATGTKADYTAGVLGCYDGEYLYIIDVKRGKWERSKRDEKIDDTTQSDLERYPDYHVRLEREGGAGGKDAVEIMAGRLSVDARVVIDDPLGKPKHDDHSMKGWETWADLLSRGRVRLVKGPWLKIFVEEHLAAPNGRNDDIIDAVSRVARGLYRRRGRQKINRPLLLLTPEEQQELGVTYGGLGMGATCAYCGGLGCNVCRHDDGDLLGAFADSDGSWRDRSSLL